MIPLLIRLLRDETAATAIEYGLIAALIALHPDHALVLRDAVEVRVSIDALTVGDLVIVKPGERIVIYNTGAGLKYLETYAERYPRA